MLTCPGNPNTLSLLHRSLHSIFPFITMAPKTHFTIPLNKPAGDSAPVRQGQRTAQTTEKIPLDQPSKRGASAKSSGSRCKAEPSEDKHISSPSSETVETIPLPFVDPQDDDIDIDDVEEGGPQFNVSIVRLTRLTH